jgi:hypothetical protein
LLEKFGEEHHRVGAALHNVAVANLRAGLLDDARDAIEEAVRIRKLTLGEKDPKVAVRISVMTKGRIVSLSYENVLYRLPSCCSFFFVAVRRTRS